MQSTAKACLKKLSELTRVLHYLLIAFLPHTPRVYKIFIALFTETFCDPRWGVERLEFIVALQPNRNSKKIPLWLTIVIICLLLNPQIFSGMKLNNSVVSMSLKRLGRHQRRPSLKHSILLLPADRSGQSESSAGEEEQTAVNKKKQCENQLAALSPNYMGFILKNTSAMASLDPKHKVNLDNSSAFPTPGPQLTATRQLTCSGNLAGPLQGASGTSMV